MSNSGFDSPRDVMPSAATPADLPEQTQREEVKTSQEELATQNMETPDVFNVIDPEKSVQKLLGLVGDQSDEVGHSSSSPSNQRLIQ